MATTDMKEEKKENLSVLPGNERPLTYKISSVPENTGRFSYGWEKYKTKFGKIVFVNLLMLVCFIPLFVLYYMYRSRLGIEGIGGVFGDNLGVGYPAAPDTTGLAESLTLRVDMLFCGFAILASFFTAVALSGGMYCVGKISRSEEELKFKDFFVGVKRGYFFALAASVLVFVVFFAAIYIRDFSAYRMAFGESKGAWITLCVLGWVAFAVASLVALWLLSVGINYRQNVWGLIKNSFRLCFGSFLQSVLFLAMVASPLLLMLIPGGFGTMLAYMWFIIAGFSTALFVWSSFNDWLYDYSAGYTTAIGTAQAKAEEETNAPKMGKEELMTLLLVGEKSAYLSRAVEPVTAGVTPYVPGEKFTGEDIAAIEESRAALKKESEAYAVAHENEERYVEYNARFRDREKVVDVSDKKGKKRKFAPRMLNQ